MYHPGIGRFVSRDPIGFGSIGPNAQGFAEDASVDSTDTALTATLLDQDETGVSSGDLNLYRYAGNSPTKATDPLGLLACSRQTVTPIKILGITICPSVSLPGKGGKGGKKVKTKKVDRIETWPGKKPVKITECIIPCPELDCPCPEVCEQYTITSTSPTGNTVSLESCHCVKPKPKK